MHVVFHKYIIPEDLLPTFNSTTIEMSEHRDYNVNYFYIRHSMDPMLKNACHEVHEKAGD